MNLTDVINCSPILVGETLRVVLASNRKPSCSSRFLIIWFKVDGVIPNSAVAFVKLYFVLRLKMIAMH